MGAAAEPAVASPCVNICRMHPATGWCEGCLRTIDEIARWGQLDDPARRGVLRQLAQRRIAWRAMGADRPVLPAGGQGPA
jgi:hypothetical protein